MTHVCPNCGHEIRVIVFRGDYVATCNNCRRSAVGVTLPEAVARLEEE